MEKNKSKSNLSSENFKAINERIFKPNVMVEINNRFWRLPDFVKQHREQLQKAAYNLWVGKAIYYAKIKNEKIAFLDE